MSSRGQRPRVGGKGYKKGPRALVRPRDVFEVFLSPPRVGDLAPDPGVAAFASHRAVASRGLRVRAGGSRGHPRRDPSNEAEGRRFCPRADVLYCKDSCAVFCVCSVPSDSESRFLDATFLGLNGPLKGTPAEVAMTGYGGLGRI